MTTPFSTSFLKLRIIAFSIISGLCFLWDVLLCVYIFIQWDVLVRPEKSIVLVMMGNYFMTSIMLLVLLLLPFRPYLDAARLLLLLITHIGVAVLFICWNPRLNCPTQTPDRKGTCELFNMYMLIGNWITPVLLIGYSAGLILAVYRHSQIADVEKNMALDNRESILPVMPVRPPSSFTTPGSSRRPSVTDFPNWDPTRSSYQSTSSAAKKHQSVPVLTASSSRSSRQSTFPPMSQRGSKHHSSLTFSDYSRPSRSTLSQPLASISEQSTDSNMGGSPKSTRLSKPLRDWVL
ncbi:hypothetical protein D9758_003254 [Tetrapyrgos nigripes]|uniref:Uncharacterized protein n=1 Tax=Tetrapyrgos nigripes TaxID=182062 RepID=A0A8H5GJ75_9AGAR|nr:hypothetical protein D9758_003254 [Tetrapyrgos nigripes]